MFATPLVLHDRIAAIVYADSGDGPDPLQETEALEILTAYSSKLLDALSAQKSAAVKTGEHMALPATPPPPAAPEPVPGRPITERPAVPSPDVANTGDGESGTIMFNSADLAALRPVTDAPTPTAVPDATPAPDLDSMDSDTRKKHEEAMRVARLLVSEIKLYNEAKVSFSLRGALFNNVETSKSAGDGSRNGAHGRSLETSASGRDAGAEGGGQREDQEERKRTRGRKWEPRPSPKLPC